MATKPKPKDRAVLNSSKSAPPPETVAPLLAAEECDEDNGPQLVSKLEVKF